MRSAGMMISFADAEGACHHDQVLEEEEGGNSLQSALNLDPTRQDRHPTQIVEVLPVPLVH
jgi:hypothetical protein